MYFKINLDKNFSFVNNNSKGGSHMVSKKNEELLNEIKTYWAKHNHLQFGALLDRLMALEGNIKPISYITDKEWLTWLKRVDEYAFFNPSVLEKLRVNRLKNYHMKLSEKEKYGKEPIPLFIDGRFNKNNYFGGDDIIRSYFTEINTCEEGLAFPEISIELDNQNIKTVGMVAQQYENKEYIHFYITITGINLQPVEQVFDLAVFGIKKEDINNIDFCWFNGKEMTEEDYCYLLNCIQATGFNFFIGNEDDEEVKQITK